MNKVFGVVGLLLASPYAFILLTGPFEPRMLAGLLVTLNIGIPNLIRRPSVRVPEPDGMLEKNPFWFIPLVLAAPAIAFAIFLIKPSEEVVVRGVVPIMPVLLVASILDALSTRRPAETTADELRLNT